METPYYSSKFNRAEPVIEQGPELLDLREILTSEVLEDQINAGNITIAMIRPDLENNTVSQIDDCSAAGEIEQAIVNLGVAVKFSIQFDKKAMNDFYDGRPREVQEAIAPDRYEYFDNRWQEFEALMVGGPSTVLFLYSPDGDAVKLWRDQVGHYDVVNKRDPLTLRGRFGLDNYNNLIHGSDSAKAVLREKQILLNLIDRTSVASTPEFRTSGYFSESLLEQLGLEKLNQDQIVQDWEPSSESYHARLDIGTPEVSDEVVLKSCIKMFPRESMEDWLNRRAVINASGIETPILRAVDGATVVEEYIPFTLREAYDNADENKKLELALKFADTFRKLSAQGFKPKSLHDIRSRGDDVVIIDFGEDLGPSGNGEGQKSYSDFSQVISAWEGAVNVRFPIV